MRIPLLLTIGELDPAPRRFLLYTCFNVISFQCIVGAVLVLFARHIGMPQSGVGVLLSFMPLTTLLVLLTFPLVTRLGPKRVMVTAWLSRNVIACSVFAMPWAMARWGPEAAWYVLGFTTLGFCTMRALGSGGWLPWLHEIVRPEQRATFFSAEAAVLQFVIVLITLGMALMLRDDAGIGRYLAVYGIGIASGLFSVIWMARVPGGKPLPDQAAMHGTTTAYWRVLKDSQYIKFLLMVSLCVSSLAWFGATVVLYMRDELGFTSRFIMGITAGGSAGVFLSIRAWARFTDHSGSGLAIFKALAGHAAVVAVFTAMLPGAPWTPYLVPPVFAFAAICGAAFVLAANRAMLGYVQIKGRVAYTNIWAVGTAMAAGITPILAGQFIQAWGIWGFRLCFALSITSALTGAALAVRTIESSENAQREWYDLTGTALPIRTLTRAVWITVGMHESNRASSDEPLVR